MYQDSYVTAKIHKRTQTRHATPANRLPGAPPQATTRMAAAVLEDSTMTAQPADGIPASGPDTGSYEVIHFGGQAAVVVPVSDFLRLRAG